MPLLLMCNGTHEIRIKDQTCSIMDEYVMSSRGICRTKGREGTKIVMQGNTTQWLLLLLDDFNVFSISSLCCVCVFTIQITFSLTLIAHTHPLTHWYILYDIECESNGNEGEKLLISIHTACKWISENCEKGGRTLLFYVRSTWKQYDMKMHQKGNQIETMRTWKCTPGIAFALAHTNKHPGSEWWRFFILLLSTHYTIRLAHKIRNWKEITSIFGACMQCQHFGRLRIYVWGCERQRKHTKRVNEGMCTTRVRYVRPYYI